MPTKIQPLSLDSPGVFGLNTEMAANINDPRWATTAENLILDDSNTLASRKGFTRQNSSSLSSTVRSICEYVIEGGSNEILFGANNNIYKTPTSPSSIYSTSITADNWKIINFNGNAYFFQDSHHPLVYNGTTCQKLVDSLTDWVAATGYVVGDVVTPTTPNDYYYVCTAGGTSHATTEPTWPTTVGNTVTDNTVTWECQEIKKGTDAFPAFGRIWMIHDDVVYGSDLLQGNKWSGGSAGYIDMSKVWPGGTDQAVAVAEYANSLVIFGSRNIAIYSGAEDPLSMRLEDIISNVGCISRDSIQSTGNDLLFLSYTGVRSLARTIVEKNHPLSNLSRNIKSDIQDQILAASNLQHIKSLYSATNSFYLLSFPSSLTVWCFDTRTPLEDGTFRVTKWTGIDPTAMCTLENNDIYFGQENYVSKYGTYLDHDSTIPVLYYTPYLDFGDGTLLKIPKQLRLVVGGGNGFPVVLKYSFDYKDNWISKTNTIVSSVTTYEYNIAEYNIAEYTNPSIVDDVKFNLSNSGTVMKFGFEINVNSAEVRFQRIDLLTKIGKRWLNI